MAATVEGADFTTQTVNGSKVRLNIKPTSSYTIWISTASRLNAPEYDSIAEAKKQLTTVKAAGYDTTLASYKDWWHDFWSKSFVQYSNASGDADYMESFYYLSTYIIAAGAFGNYPFHFINGVFSAVEDSDSGKWSNAYWYWNQRDIYHSFLASNHADMVEVFNNLYSRNFDTLKAYTQTRYGIDGIWVPETMGWNASAAGTINSDYTQDTLSTASEAAMNMYAQYKYTNDTDYLKNIAYPFMREAAKFYAAKLSFDETTGQYFMESSNVHEQHWDVKNAITDLAAVRDLFPAAIKTSEDLQLDADLRLKWQDVLDNLVPYPLDPNDPNQYLPHAPPLSQNRNNENSILELAWPYNVSGIGYPDYQKLLNGYNNRPYKYTSNNVWDPAPIQAARLGLGDEAYLGMRMMLQRYQQYPNGRTTNTNGEYEYMGVHLLAMNESLLQSYNDKIRVFPALPTDAAFVSKFTLSASGGFQVSSEKDSDEIKYVGIKSLYGNPATVVNPWGTEAVQVRKVSDNSVVTTSSSGEFTFNTDADTVYVVERTAKPLSNYTHAKLTGTANEGVKSLSGTSSKLGLSAAGGRVAITTFYADGSYGGTDETLAPGSYTTAQLMTANIPNNWASSVRVTAGYTVAVYDNDNFTGTKWLFTSDTDFPSGTNPNANDKMSSVKIYLSDGSTKVEAESGTLSNPANKYADAAASDGHAVKFEETGDSLTFENSGSASKIIFTYATASDPGQISLYINGVFSKPISFPTNGVWQGGYPSLTVPVNIPGGATVKFQLDDGDSAVNLDSLSYISMDLSGVGVDVASNLITGTTVDMQYSLDSTDGLNGTWTTATAGSTTVMFLGGKVYIRDISDPGHFALIATVPPFSGPKYEAESGARTGSTNVASDSKASEGKVVDHFSNNGDSVSLSNVATGSRLIIAYCTDNNPGRLSLYINGVDSGNITFPTTHGWNTNYSTVTVTKAIPAGATVKLQLDSGDSGANIDYMIVQSQDLTGVSLNTATSQITGTNTFLEYSVNSTDGRNGTWTAAKADNTPVVMAPGKIFVREAANPNNYKLLQTIIGQMYEAENTTLTKVDASSDGAASGGKAVTGLSTPGSSSMVFTSTAKGGQLVIGYTTANANSKLSLYVDDKLIKSVGFPTTGVWSGAYAVVKTNVSIPAGSAVKLMLNNGDSGSNIDYFIVQPLDNFNGVSVNVGAGQISGTTEDMEYSLDSTDGSDGSWAAAGTGTTPVAFVPGKIYLRVVDNHSINSLLATV
ncbi:hypothetical protein K0U00_20415, partial [Paenibacillus sepulcri]|nr:hypothetical protein [Paenibacillus sepulcri]